MSEFFFLHLLDREGAPVAYGVDDIERDQLLVEPGRVWDWPGLELELRGGRPTDYLANNVGVRLCSARLREVIEQHRGPEDELQWLEAQVIDDTDAKHAYFVLHFVSLPDVLDPERTIRARGEFVVKPVLSRERVGSHRVISFPGAVISVIVADQVKAGIEKAKCTGVDFGQVALA